MGTRCGSLCRHRRRAVRSGARGVAAHEGGGQARVGGDFRGEGKRGGVPAERALLGGGRWWPPPGQSRSVPRAPWAPTAPRVRCPREREGPARGPAPPPPPSRPGPALSWSRGPLGPRPGRAARRASPGEQSATGGLAARAAGAGTPADTGEWREGGGGAPGLGARGREKGKPGQSSERTLGRKRDSEP